MHAKASPSYCKILLIHFRIFRAGTNTFAELRRAFPALSCNISSQLQFLLVLRCSKLLQTQPAEVPFFLKLGRYQNTPFLWSENCCCVWTTQRRNKPTALTPEQFEKFPCWFLLCGKGKKRLSQAVSIPGHTWQRHSGEWLFYFLLVQRSCSLYRDKVFKKMAKFFFMDGEEMFSLLGLNITAPRTQDLMPHHPQSAHLQRVRNCRSTRRKSTDMTRPVM